MDTDDKAEYVHSQTTVSEGKHSVSRPKKVVRNPWNRAGKSKNIQLNLAYITEPTTYEEAAMSPRMSATLFSDKTYFNSTNPFSCIWKNGKQQ